MGDKKGAALGEDIHRRLADTLDRMMAAWERARELIARSAILRRNSRDICADIPSPVAPASVANATTGVDDDVVWSCDNGRVRCQVIPHAFDDHEVVLTVHDSVIWFGTFGDPLEATNEAMRLRRLFIGDEPAK